MKKHLRSKIAVFICLVICILNTMLVSAATAEEVKDRWYDTHYYPLYQGNEEWQQKHTYFEILDILNPPPDLLLSMPTEELAELMLEYPLLWQMTTYFGPDGELDYSMIFIFVEYNCDIFYQLLRREDGITCLLEAYRAHGLEPEKEHRDKFDAFYTEMFVCHFIDYYSHLFTDSEYELACQIIEEKKEIYSSLEHSKLYYLYFSEIKPPTGEEVGDIRTIYLEPEEIQEKEDILAAALLQMQSEENSSHTEIPETEESNVASQEENNESIIAEPVENQSHEKTMIIVGAIIGVMCIGGGFVFIGQRRKGE